MRCAIALLFALTAVSAQAEIFKCKNKDGSTSFADHPCASDATTLSVPKSASKDAPVNWLCDSEGSRLENLGDMAALPDRQRRAVQNAAAAVSASGDMRLVTEHGNVHVCVRAPGSPANAPAISESVVTLEGQTWVRANGKTRRVGDGEEAAGGAACTSRVRACIGPENPKVEACIASIPACGAAADGACCPKDCLGSYQTSRAQGLPVADSVQRMVTLPICAGAQ